MFLLRASCAVLDTKYSASWAGLFRIWWEIWRDFHICGENATGNAAPFSALSRWRSFARRRRSAVSFAQEQSGAFRAWQPFRIMSKKSFSSPLSSRPSGTSSARRANPRPTLSHRPTSPRCRRRGRRSPKRHAPCIATRWLPATALAPGILPTALPRACAGALRTGAPCSMRCSRLRLTRR